MIDTESLLHQARFLKSTPVFDSCPPDIGREVAFAGRSNAGKSSAINCLVGQKALARTSKQPGRTQQINFFQLDDERRLVDLPGYGYAKVGKSMRRQWAQCIDDYLSRRDSLVGLVLLMDIRHPFKEVDQMLIEWSASAAMPLHILMTKADKLSFGAGKRAIMEGSRKLANHPTASSLQLFSAKNGDGKQLALQLLGNWLQVTSEGAFHPDDSGT